MIIRPGNELPGYCLPSLAGLGPPWRIRPGNELQGCCLSSGVMKIVLILSDIFRRVLCPAIYNGDWLENGGWIGRLAFKSGSKSVYSCAVDFAANSNPPFFEPTRRLSAEKATARRGEWWVGILTRLEDRRFKKKSNCRQLPGSDPPTLRSRTRPWQIAKGTNPDRKYTPKKGGFSSPHLSSLAGLAGRKSRESPCMFPDFIKLLKPPKLLLDGQVFSADRTEATVIPGAAETRNPGNPQKRMVSKLSGK